MRIGCVFFPNFAVQVEVRDNDALSSKPIIIGGFPYQLKAVHDASKEAIGQGVKRGMPYARLTLYVRKQHFCLWLRINTMKLSPVF